MKDVQSVMLNDDQLIASNHRNAHEEHTHYTKLHCNQQHFAALCDRCITSIPRYGTRLLRAYAYI
jgi:hypothetical protein